MREHGDWLHPWLLGEHAYYKPPFQLWATLIGWKIFGFGLIGAFLPSILAVLLTAACIGWISKRVHSLSSEQVTAPLWFAAAAGTLTYGTTAQMEIWIVALYSLAWVAALQNLITGKRRWLFAALIAAGVLSIVKSPLYSVLWVWGYWLYLGLTSQKNKFTQPSFWLAHLVGALVGAAWFIYALITDRQKFISDYFVRETLAKTGGNSSTALHMWGDFSTFCVPFLLPAIVVAILSLNKRHRSLRPFIIAFAALPTIFFTFFPYRTETYLYILIPLVAILMDLRLGLQNSKLRSVLYGVRLNGLLMLVAGTLFAVFAVSSGMIAGWTGGILTALACAFAFVSFSRRSREWKTLAFAALAITCVVRLGAIELGEQDIRDLRVFQAEHPDRPLVFLDPGGYIWHEVGLLSVAVGQPGIRARSTKEFSDAVKNGALGVLSDGDWPANLPLIRQELLNQGFALDEASWWRWKRSIQIPTFSNLRKLKQNRREYKLVMLKPAVR
ncbi:MAG: glycosyltransferase family 39 protein [Oligoflexia bacterium]|nr:glycosyltransferase family 39 protein [Oligoflexia bacterium]